MSRNRREHGYNLVEVLIAMAIFGAVVLSIFTLFFMGRWNVYSGKQATAAVAIGNRVIEDLSSMNIKTTYNGAFGIAATDTGLRSVTFSNPSATYTGCRVRSTNPAICSPAPTDIQTDNIGYVTTKWPAALANNLTNGSVTVILTPRNDAAHPTAPQFGSASTMSIRVLVRWTERTRPRELILDTVKTY